MKGQTRQEVLAAISLERLGEKGRALFSFASPEECLELSRMANRLAKSGESGAGFLEQACNRERFGRRMSADEIHPDWIAEVLRDETPRLYRLLPKLFSPQKIEALQGSLTQEERRQGISSGRSVSPAILRIVRSVLERRFGSHSVLRLEEGFSLSDVVTLKGEDLELFFSDIGLEVVSKAFSNLEPSVVRAFVTRFPLSVATEIRKRIDSKKGIPFEERKKAQAHLVHLSLGKIPSEHFFLEVGFSIFVYALGSEERVMIEDLCHKFPIDIGYRFKRLLREGRGEPEEGTLRDEVLTRLLVLASQGRIRRYWKEDKEVEPTGVYRLGGEAHV